jgi:Transposase DDE domain group 1
MVLLLIETALGCVAHGHQEMAEWNAHYDERCFLPIHIYDTATGRPVTMIPRPGKTPSGKEVRGWLRRLIKRIRQHWPKTRITIRGDGHYGRDEAMIWCENNGVDYIFGFAGNTVLDRQVVVEAGDIRTRRAEGRLAILRGYAETRYGAKSWTRERRVAARIEAEESGEDDMLRRGLDIRYVVTSLKSGNAEHLYATVYCARGQAENLIKQHKAQTASDRTSCRSPLANQFRLIPHTAAYWLLLDVRDHVPSWHPRRPERIHQHPPPSLEDRRAHRRDCEPHPCCVGLLLSGSRTDRSRRVPAATARAMNARARRPWNPYRQLPARKQRSHSSLALGTVTCPGGQGRAQQKAPSKAGRACIRRVRYIF